MHYKLTLLRQLIEIPRKNKITLNIQRLLLVKRLESRFKKLAEDLLGSIYHTTKASLGIQVE